MFSCLSRFFRKTTIGNEDTSGQCQPNLQNMPTVVMEEVLKNLNAKSIFCLRKVCRNLRSTIDRIEPKLHVTSLSFEPPITEKSIELRVKNMSKSERKSTLNWLKPRTGCEIKWEFEGKTRSSNTSMKDADTLLKNTNIILDELKINFLSEPSYAMDRDCKYSNEKTLKSIFENRGHLLETKEVVFRVHNLLQAAEFLKRIDPKSLKSISIATSDRDYSELENLEQWKNADALKTGGYNILDCFNYFTSFKSVFIEVFQFRIEKLNEVKELFIRSPKMETFTIKFADYDIRTTPLYISYFNHMVSPNEEPVNNPVHLFGSREKPRTWTWVMDVPDSTQQLQITLTIDCFTHNITFLKT
ncbi:unnamed protein product [Caenorhabditis brenneri]